MEGVRYAYARGRRDGRRRPYGAYYSVLYLQVMQIPLQDTKRTIKEKDRKEGTGSQRPGKAVEIIASPNDARAGQRRSEPAFFFTSFCSSLSSISLLFVFFYLTRPRPFTTQSERSPFLRDGVHTRALCMVLMCVLMRVRFVKCACLRH